MYDYVTILGPSPVTRQSLMSARLVERYRGFKYACVEKGLISSRGFLV